MRFKCCGENEDLNYKKLLNRFLLEPRADIRTGRFLVVWDCDTLEYLKVPGNKKRYMRFRDSVQAYHWIMAQQRVGAIK